MSSSSYNCVRDGCNEKFDSQRGWSQHVHRVHTVHPGTSLLQKVLSDNQDRKRRRAEEEETQRAAKRQELEVQEENPPVEPMVRPHPALWAKVPNNASNRPLCSTSLSTQPCSDPIGSEDSQNASLTLFLRQTNLHHCLPSSSSNKNLSPRAPQLQPRSRLPSPRK